ncbi:glutamate 5-kinase [Arachnia propionica]|uniref:Glutamate 5-kinase n=1 Tax=Arachnia propionica TaxID=1750 RepID=A0A3P1T6J9_9ACTN|nr:glutamate 5-kinase [Arachnia propionica]RRD05004.1 glutamate 5-kinase [Arachnia propionica]
MRAEVADAERIVVKIGSSSLTDETGHLAPGRVAELAEHVAALHARGTKVVLVSSGAIASALLPLGLTRRPGDLETQQAAAAVGQGILVRHYSDAFAVHGLLVAQILLTAGDLQDGRSYRNALNTVSRLLRLGVIPVINENDTVATSEIRFGDNDRLAALVAHLVRADALVILSDVDGLYTAHPAEPGAELIRRVPDIAQLTADTSRVGSRVGTGGMSTKVEAARIATSGGVSVVLAHADQLRRALDGQEVGTFFDATGRRRPRRMLWLAHAAEVRGVLRIDEGAERALGQGRASLLAAGIIEIVGEFEAGDPVDIIGLSGDLLARGLVDCAAQTLARRVCDGGLAVHRDLLIEMVQ